MRKHKAEYTTLSVHRDTKATLEEVAKLLAEKDPGAFGNKAPAYPAYVVVATAVRLLKSRLMGTT